MKLESDLKEEIYSCIKCSHLGLGKDLSKGIIPLIGEGNPINPVWIIGLNPKIEERLLEIRSKSFDTYIQFQVNYFEKNTIHSYFKDFKHIFGENWIILFQKYIFNTDLVKCPSKEWDKVQRSVIDVCSKYLRQQLELYHPSVVFCNGVHVIDWFKKNYSININEYDTIGMFKIGNQSLRIIFSGFVGRMDNYSRRRIRRDFIESIDELGLEEIKKLL